MIEPGEIELLDEAFASVRSFATELRQTPADAAWFRDLLASLLEAATVEYHHLKLGLRHSTAVLAWSCRNLLELNIYTQYVLRSESDAQRFARNRVADGIDTFEAFQSWLARNDPSLVPPEVDAALRHLSELRAQEDEPPRLYSLKYLSAEVGLADEYAHMTRICAKLSQPGVFGITSGEHYGTPFQSALFRAGAGHGVEIHQAIKEHLSLYGCAPRT